MNRAWNPPQSRRRFPRCGGCSLVFSQASRIPEHGLGTTMGRLCTGKRAIYFLSGFGIEDGLRVACCLSRDWSPLLRPLVIAPIKKTHILVPVIEKRPSNHSHHLAWRVVHNYGYVVPNAQTARDASEIFRTCHITIGLPRDTAKPAQIYRAGNVTGGVLLWWTRVDNAAIRVIQTFRKPICFSKQLRVCVTTLMYRNDRHKFLLSRHRLIEWHLTFFAPGDQRQPAPCKSFWIWCEIIVNE